MSDNVIHAIIRIQNWGDQSELVSLLKQNPHILSIFHVMGRYSYLLDVNFDSKQELSTWISTLKKHKLTGGFPAIIGMQTQRIIDAPKIKEDFYLTDYRSLSAPYHFFMALDSPHHDEKLLELLKGSDIVYTVLHVQGEHSFMAEVIVEDYNKYRDLLKVIKDLGTVSNIETQEVISVLKYRNSIMDSSGSLIHPEHDIRELYML